MRRAIHATQEGGIAQNTFGIKVQEGEAPVFTSCCHLGIEGAPFPKVFLHFLFTIPDPKAIARNRKSPISQRGQI